MRNLSSANTPTGTAILNSCRKGFEFFNQQLFRIPSNGKRILLWEDKIFGNPPLSSVIPLSEIMNWATNKGLLCLADICTWDSSRNWVGWSIPDLPACLKSQKHMLLLSLTCLAPRKMFGVGEWMDFILYLKVAVPFNLPIVHIFLLQSGIRFGLLNVCQR